MRIDLFGRNRGMGGRTRRRMSWKVRLIPIVLFAIYGLYYYVSNQETVPITGRSQLVDMTREQEMSLGLQSYQEILSQSQVIRQGEAVTLIKTIGQKLARAAADVDPGFNWEFNVIQSKQANAFALPGGKTAVYTGLFSVAENANGLAVVMGHEIAHAIARHGAERMAYQKLVRIGSMAASVALGDMDFQGQTSRHGSLRGGRPIWSPPAIFTGS